MEDGRWVILKSEGWEVVKESGGWSEVRVRRMKDETRVMVKKVKGVQEIKSWRWVVMQWLD